jgi:hypothetical protein
MMAFDVSTIVRVFEVISLEISGVKYYLKLLSSDRAEVSC